MVNLNEASISILEKDHMKHKKTHLTILNLMLA
jgi:hypothetical protein